MLTTIIIAVAILAFLIFIHEVGHFIAARIFGMRVEEFGFGFPPRLWGIKKGNTLYSINAIPLGGFVQIAGEDSVSTDENGLEKDKHGSKKGDRFSDKPIWQRAVVLCAGVAMNFLVGWLVLMPVLMTGTPESVVVTGVVDDAPAAVAGIKEGDVIMGFESGNDFSTFVADHKGEQITLAINREGKEIIIAVTPRIDVPEGEGSLGVEYVAGSIEKMGFGQAIKESLRYAWTIFSFVFVTIGRLLASVVTGEPIFSQLSGPVGVYKATAQAVGLGWVYVANVMALISLNLAALNIFPFPALDGGRLVFLVIEKIRGKAVSGAIQGWVNGVAFLALILFIVAITVKDVATMF